MASENFSRIAQYNVDYITNIAKGCFFSTGIQKTSVEKIAKLGNISRVTIYKYFPTKLDIAVSVLCQYVHNDSAYIRENLLSKSYEAKSGYEQIRAQLFFFSELQLENPAFLPFLSEINVLLCNDDATRNMNKSKCLSYIGLNALYSSAVQKGLQDGSICKRSEFEEKDYLLVRKIMEGMMLKCYLCYGREHFFIHQKEVHDKLAFAAEKILTAFFKP